MIPSSACLLRQSDRAANAARKHRSYTTLWGTISSSAETEENHNSIPTGIPQGSQILAVGINNQYQALRVPY
jgi:hypothetical protein